MGVDLRIIKLHANQTEFALLKMSQNSSASLTFFDIFPKQKTNCRIKNEDFTQAGINKRKFQF